MEDNIFLSYNKYSKNIVKKFGLEDGKNKRTHVKLTKDENREAVVPPMSSEVRALTTPTLLGEIKHLEELIISTGKWAIEEVLKRMSIIEKFTISSTFTALNFEDRLQLPNHDEDIIFPVYYFMLINFYLLF